MTGKHCSFAYIRSCTFKILHNMYLKTDYVIFIMYSNLVFFHMLYQRNCLLLLIHEYMCLMDHFAFVKQMTCSPCSCHCSYLCNQIFTKFRGVFRFFLFFILFCFFLRKEKLAYSWVLTTKLKKAFQLKLKTSFSKLWLTVGFFKRW